MATAMQDCFLSVLQGMGNQGMGNQGMGMGNQGMGQGMQQVRQSASVHA